MKFILILALLTIGDRVTASDINDFYCADKSKKVYVVPAEDASVVSQRGIQRAEVVGRLPSGNIVIIPCYGKVKYKKNIPSLQYSIVSFERVFYPIEGREMGDFKAVGINREVSKVLVEQRLLLLRKEYHIVPIKVKVGSKK